MQIPKPTETAAEKERRIQREIYLMLTYDPMASMLRQSDRFESDEILVPAVNLGYYRDPETLYNLMALQNSDIAVCQLAKFDTETGELHINYDEIESMIPAFLSAISTNLMISAMEQEPLETLNQHHPAESSLAAAKPDLINYTVQTSRSLH